MVIIFVVSRSRKTQALNSEDIYETRKDFEARARNRLIEQHLTAPRYALGLKEPPQAKEGTHTSTGESARPLRSVPTFAL